jgi:hypothetical protein
VSAPAATLAEYADTELRDWYSATTEPAWQPIIEAEMQRRDEADAAARQRHEARCARRDEPVTTDWRTAAYAQYLAAERACCGNLAVRDAPFADAFTLWSRTEAFAQKWATEELKQWWLAHPRVTVTAYRAQVRQQRETYRNDAMESDGPGDVQPAAQGNTDSARAQHRQRPGGEPGSRPAGHPGHALAAGRPGRQERPAVNMITHAERAIRTGARGELARRANARRQPSEPSTALAQRPQGTVATTGQQLDGAQVLGYVAAYLDEFASFASPAARDAVALWATHCHVRDNDGRLMWRATPRLLLVSSEPGSGKTRVLELLGRLCPNVFGIDSEPTVAALAHTLGREHASVLLDEADILFGRGARKEGVRAVLNAGYLPNGTVLKMRGSKADRVAVFGPVALAGLDVIETATGGTLEALLSRCIRIRMRRATAPVADLTVRADRGGALLGRALASWAGAHAGELADAAPELPEGVHGRQAQIWTPLLAIAEAAGADWPDRAWDALYELGMRGGVSASEDDDTMSELADMFGRFDTAEES